MISFLKDPEKGAIEIKCKCDMFVDIDLILISVIEIDSNIVFS